MLAAWCFSRDGKSRSAVNGRYYRNAYLEVQEPKMCFKTLGYIFPTCSVNSEETVTF